jgi:hypothetical protein
MSCLMRIVMIGPHWLKEGVYLRSYEPSTADGCGDIVMTEDRAKAKVFADPAEALACWKQQSTTLPLRPDGRPNRPLTVATVEIVSLEPKEKH